MNYSGQGHTGQGTQYPDAIPGAVWKPVSELAVGDWLPLTHRFVSFVGVTQTTPEGYISVRTGCITRHVRQNAMIQVGPRK